MEVSLNDTIDIDRDGNPLTYLDIISTPETIAEDIEMNTHIEKIRNLVDTALDERMREIIVLRYGLHGYQPKTQREVANYLGISRSYVSRIEKRALEILKDSFGSKMPNEIFLTLPSMKRKSVLWQTAWSKTPTPSPKA